MPLITDECHWLAENRIKDSLMPLINRFIQYDINYQNMQHKCTKVAKLIWTGLLLVSLGFFMCHIYWSKVYLLYYLRNVSWNPQIMNRTLAIIGWQLAIFLDLYKQRFAEILWPFYRKLGSICCRSLVGICLICLSKVLTRLFWNS